MKKNIFLFFSISLLLVIFNLSCNTTEPDDIKPGRRDYSWTVDTLDSPNNVIKSLWGAVVNDVWAVGPGGITAYDGLWHFDGNIWKPYEQALPISPECIYGITQNDIWMGGSDGKIFHFNGAVWNQVYSINRLDTSGNWINDIWGDNVNDIYAIGYAYLAQESKLRSFILHFNGIKWKEIYFSSKQIQFLRIQKDNNKLFLSGLISSQTIEPDTLLFFKLENNVLSEIYRNTMDKIAFISLSQIGYNTYFLIGQDLNKYENGKFIKIISFNNQAFGYQSYGRNEKDIFIRMTDGLAHYNGENLEYLNHFSNSFTSILQRALLFEKDVFFTIHDNLNDHNLILRGKLSE